MDFIYIAVDPERIHGCKVGISNNPERRLKSFKTANPQMYMYKTWAVPNRLHEKSILDLLHDVFNKRSEWIYGHPSLVANIIDGYFVDYID